MIVRMISALSVMLLVLVILPGANPKALAGDSLRVNLQLRKPTVLVGDEMPVNIYLVNTTNRTLTVWQQWMTDLFLRLDCRDSRGDSVPRSLYRMYTLACPLPTSTIAAGDSQPTWRNVASTFGRSVAKSGSLFGQIPGEYSLVAVYDNQVTSNVVRYTVGEPTGEEKAVYDKLAGILRRHNIQYMVPDVPELEALLSSHPQSVYAPTILAVLRGTYENLRIQDNEKVIEYGKRLVENYPDSWEVSLAVHDIGRCMETSELLKYLATVQLNKSGTLAAREARGLERSTRDELKKKSERK